MSLAQCLLRFGAHLGGAVRRLQVEPGQSAWELQKLVAENATSIADGQSSGVP
jgi:hypothetical protein